MKETVRNDPRPAERFQWIAQYREVVPPDLNSCTTIEEPKLKSTTVTAGLEKYTGNWGEKEAKHLLGRTLFGVRKEEITRFKSLSIDEAVDLLLTSTPMPAPPVNDYEGLNGAHDPHVAEGMSWLEAPHAKSDEGLRIVSLKNWLIGNAIGQTPSIKEKMVLFWSNLLVTKVWDVYIAKASFQYFKMVYNQALGNYKSFIKNLTLDPSMLIFLNGKDNTKAAPDENYGRELQELFCVGKGSGSKYTEGDVQSAARVLTGFKINWQPYENPGIFSSYFDHFQHDKERKRFSEFYNNRIIDGKLGGAGKEELDELLDMIFNAEETACYICRRFYTFFVSNEINETVEQQIIIPLANLFRTENFEIRPVLATLFKSAHFFDELNRGVLIKSPADHLFGLWRTLHIYEPAKDTPVLNYELHRAMLWHMSGLGMEIGDPPNVAGWAPYYQAPQFDKSWITTNTITKRALTTDSLIYWGFWVSGNRTVKADLLALVNSFDNPSDPNKLINEAIFLFLGLELKENTNQELKSILLSGQQNDFYWTSAWNSYIADQQNETLKSVVLNRLKPFFQRIFQLAEFHLM